MTSKLFLAPALALSFALTAAAQTHKIAVIDMQGALLQTTDGQKASEELKTKFSPKETEFQRRQQEITTKQDALRKGDATMSADQKASAARDLDSLTRTLQRDEEDAKADFQTEENRLLGQVLNKMQAVMQKYSTDNQIAMIFDISVQPNNLIFADPSTNITTAIVALYNKANSVSPSASSAPKAPAPTTSRPAATAPARAPATAAPKPAAK